MSYPSEYEIFSGETFNPLDGEKEIDQANCVINSFVNDMESGRVPSAIMSDLVKATYILGLYAGYPLEAAHMEEYIKKDTDKAVSYNEIAKNIKLWSTEMNSLINKRIDTIKMTTARNF
jgi:hypothetical protein